MSSSPGRVLSSLVVALLSRPCVTDIRSTDLRSTTSPQPTPCWFFLFLPPHPSHVVVLQEYFFAPHLPAWCSDSCCVCVSAGGFWDSEGEGRLLDKKEGGVQFGPLQTRRGFFFFPLFVVHPYCPTAQLGKKIFFPPLPCSFCSAGGERNVGVKWALFVMPWPFISLWNSPFISWPTFAARLSDFSPRSLTHMGSWIAFTPVIVG